LDDFEEYIYIMIYMHANHIYYNVIVLLLLAALCQVWMIFQQIFS